MVSVSYLELVGFALLVLAVWQLLVLIACQFVRDDEAALAFSIFLWLPFVFITKAVLSRVKLSLGKRYNYYQFFGPNQKLKSGDIMPKWCVNLCMTPDMAKRFRQVDKKDLPKEYCIRLLREGHEFKSAPHKVDILKKKHLQTGMPTQGLTKEFLEKFLV